MGCRASVREAIAQADAVFTDANLSSEALARIPKLVGEKPIFAIAISPAKVLRLKDILPALSCLFLNTREAGALTGLGPEAPASRMLDALRALGLRRAVLSKGPCPVVALDEDRMSSITPPRPRGIADVTGAGDALAGAAAAAMLCGLPFAEAVREGMAAALLALESSEAAPALSRAAFEAALALVPSALSSGTTDYLWCISIFEKDSDGFVAELPTNLDTKAVLSLFGETDPERIQGELSIGLEHRDEVRHLTGIEIDLKRFDYFVGARSAA